MFHGGAFNMSASVKAYCALKAIGDAPDAPHMARAQMLKKNHLGRCMISTGITGTPRHGMAPNRASWMRVKTLARSAPPVSALGHGGAERANVFTRIQLALFGAIPWRGVPVMPVRTRRGLRARGFSACSTRSGTTQTRAQ
jgi:squalene-hopene/tetraprenyl-beta-curcumene cyclase